MVAFSVNPFTFQTDVIETASSTGRLIQARAEESEMENMDIHDDVLKDMRTFGIWLTNKSFLP
jgi:hypothetical protein